MVIPVSGFAVSTDDPPEVNTDMVVELYGFGWFDTLVDRVDTGKVGSASAIDLRKCWLQSKDLAQSLK